VLSQVVGGVARACVVVLVVSTPALMIPGTSAEGHEAATLLALGFGIFVAVEYAARAPSLVEFRDAPPFNRFRLLAFFVTLFLLSLVASAKFGEGSSLAIVASAFGLVAAALLDVPFGPLQVALAQLPPGLDPVLATKITAMTGLALLVLLTATIAFALLARLGHWPRRDRAFNLWINLPTFDPNGGGDVVSRLRRSAIANMILALAAPFVLPLLAALVAPHVGPERLGAPQVMVWGIALWMFIPLSLFMRGIAMVRIAAMIAQHRDRQTAARAADVPSAPAFLR
jgi:hypothetical protein